MRYFARLGDEDFELEVRAADGGLEVVCDGVLHPVDVAAVVPGEKYSLLVGTRSYAVTVDGDGRRIELVIDGRGHHVEVEDERERASREIGHGGPVGGGVVTSVMPGIVRRIEAQPGAPVAAGDRLLILEAMKMENEICAEAAGIVEKVHVSEGQTVEGGQQLVTIAPPAE